jgi:hypothetical protein
MPPLEAFVPSLAIGLVLFVMLWFALGTQRNIRRGNDILRWLQSGLPLIGQRTTLRWLGSSAAELTIADALPPFRDATVVIVLEPRDIPLLWAFARSRGRRDFLIVRANLRRSPRFVVDAGDPGAWTGPGDAVGTDPEIQSVDWADGIVARASPGADTSTARTAWDRLAEVSDAVWRVTVQPVVPHLEVHLRPPDPRLVSADRVLAPIRDLGDTLVRDGHTRT